MLHFNVVFLFLKFQKHVAASPSRVRRTVTALESIHLGSWPGSWPGTLNLHDSEFSRIIFWGAEETSGNIEKLRIISNNHNHREQFALDTESQNTDRPYSFQLPPPSKIPSPS